ncbi:MAG: YkgJ family cysteine cluster protein [Saprospiraceae bacterium]
MWAKIKQRIIKYELNILDQKAFSKRKRFKQKLKGLKAKSNAEVDAIFQSLHEKSFRKINCLDCANCCKTTGPLFTRSDIARIAKKMNLKQKNFIKKYLWIDEDGDYVLQSVPCIFLLPDNHCSIYDFRPKACCEYPHTDMAGQKNIFNLTLRNAAVCPAVFEILEKLD